MDILESNVQEDKQVEDLTSSSSWFNNITNLYHTLSDEPMQEESTYEEPRECDECEQQIEQEQSRIQLFHNHITNLYHTLSDEPMQEEQDEHLQEQEQLPEDVRIRWFQKHISNLSDEHCQMNVNSRHVVYPT